MTNILLALIPGAMVVGILSWALATGARAQIEATAFAKEWARKNHK